MSQYFPTVISNNKIISNSYQQYWQSAWIFVTLNNFIKKGKFAEMYFKRDKNGKPIKIQVHPNFTNSFNKLVRGEKVEWLGPNTYYDLAVLKLPQRYLSRLADE